MLDIIIPYRHSHTSLLFAAGVEPRVIQDRLGHSNIQTTLDIYTHTDYHQQAIAAQYFDNMFKQKTS